MTRPISITRVFDTIYTRSCAQLKTYLRTAARANFSNFLKNIMRLTSWSPMLPSRSGNKERRRAAKRRSQSGTRQKADRPSPDTNKQRYSALESSPKIPDLKVNDLPWTILAQNPPSPSNIFNAVLLLLLGALAHLLIHGSVFATNRHVS